MLFRAALLALSAAAAGVEMGRRAARKAVDQESAAATKAAVAEARERIRQETQSIAGDILRRFAISTTIKAVIAIALWSAAWAGWIGSTTFAIAFALVIALFLIRDVYIAWPALSIIGGELRGSGWKAKTALAEYAARKVESEALVRADATELGWKERLALMLAGTDKAGVAADIAAATAEAVRETTWRDVRPLVLASAAKAAIGFAVYAAFVTLLAANVS